MNFSIFPLLLYPPLHFSRHFLLLLLAERMNLPIHNAPSPPTFSFAFSRGSHFHNWSNRRKRNPPPPRFPFSRVTGGVSSDRVALLSTNGGGLRAGGGEKGSQMARPHVIQLPLSPREKGIKRISRLASPCVSPQQKTNVGGISLSPSLHTRIYCGRAYNRPRLSWEGKKGAKNSPPFS